MGGWASTGKLTAHLSNSAAADYVNVTPTSGTGQYDAVYTITYNAAQAGQTITITWVQSAGTGNVTIQGAALTGTAKSNEEISTDKTAVNSDITVYPNPVNGGELNIAGNTNITEVSVFNLQGQKIDNILVNNSAAKLNTSSYCKGIYLLKISTKDGVINKRIMVE